MTTGAKVTAVLNKDEKARKLLDAMDKAAKKAGYDENTKEYKGIREVVVLMAMLGNEKAKEIFATDLYNELRAS